MKLAVTIKRSPLTPGPETPTSPTTFPGVGDEVLLRPLHKSDEQQLSAHFTSLGSAQISIPDTEQVCAHPLR